MGFLFPSTHAERKYIYFMNISFLVFSSSVLLISYYNPSATVGNFKTLRSDLKPLNGNSIRENDCSVLNQLKAYKSKCIYLKSNGPCVNQGFIDYLSFLYCNFEEFHLLGYLLLFLWLLVLFYLLGDTASEYFCSSLESLSKLLHLSPTIAGVTLLSLGNGAPDVFASLVSFMGKSKGTYDIGLNTVVGGASVVTCAVVGIISISLHKKRVRIEKSAFFRDICFFLLVVGSLFAIFVHERINLWGAIGFCSIYVVYVAVVYVSWKLGLKGIEFVPDSIHSNDLNIPILEKEEVVCIEEGAFGDGGRDSEAGKWRSWRLLIRVLEMPLYLLRRLTIPVVSETKWSKQIAVISATLAPVLLSVLWNSQFEQITSNTSFVIYGIGCFLGLILGFLAFFTTDESHPPEKWLLPWLVGGFIMSITWSYTTAKELVALITSLGYIFGLSPSILGLTVLAWGNSLGDLITNLTMALHGGNEGAQVAVSGCYAGPIFNMLFGLGLSLVGSAWYEYPSSVVIQTDPYVLETLGFLVVGFGWTLVLLPRKEMKLDRVLGVGLLVIYLVSLTLRLVQTIWYD